MTRVSGSYAVLISAMVFVYDYHPASETLMSRHFNNPAVHMNGYSNPYNLDGSARPYSAGKGRELLRSYWEVN